MVRGLTVKGTSHDVADLGHAHAPQRACVVALVAALLVGLTWDNAPGGMGGYYSVQNAPHLIEIVISQKEYGQHWTNKFAAELPSGKLHRKTTPAVPRTSYGAPSPPTNNGSSPTIALRGGGLGGGFGAAAGG